MKGCNETESKSTKMSILTDDIPTDAIPNDAKLSEMIRVVSK
jgi:hypothetical protein